MDDEDVGAGAGPAERAHHAGGDGPAPERRRRMSAGRKQDAVLRLLRGEALELVSRELGVTAAALSGWREAFLAGSAASLKSRPMDAREISRHVPKTFVCGTFGKGKPATSKRRRWCILGSDSEARPVREETAMPTYSYRCQACGETFERIETITEHGTDKPRCPKCHGEEVVEVPTRFVAMTGKKS